MDRSAILPRPFRSPVGRRPRRALRPAVRPLEDRRLLTGGSAASATMTQTATFPDLESYPTVSNQAILYFSATMGTLTEVDVVTSGSFQSQFSAENLASTARTIAGTTSANLSIGVPTGAIPVSIPSVTQSFNASAYDGTLDYGGTSGKTMPTVTSQSSPQTEVLTSPADLADFTGHFRIPITVSGHATGSVTPDDSQVSSTFDTDTSATITVIYHYIPNLSGSGGSSGSPVASSGGGTTQTPITATGTTPTQGGDGGSSALTAASTTQGRHHASSKARIASHHQAHPAHRLAPAQADASRHHSRGLVRTAHHGS